MGIIADKGRCISCFLLPKAFYWFPWNLVNAESVVVRHLWVFIAICTVFFQISLSGHIQLLSCHCLLINIFPLIFKWSFLMKLESLSSLVAGVLTYLVGKNFKRKKEKWLIYRSLFNMCMAIILFQILSWQTAQLTLLLRAIIMIGCGKEFM